ncbi:hypothetical protein H2248_012528 [Termitomyces sp. 'cryptogamus']|nr:hypothetical protein H2248_012528 [Termitomyces sp. 'cryptogamus']
MTQHKPLPDGFSGHTCGTATAPYVVSNSQTDHEYRFAQFFLGRQCAEFAMLVLGRDTVLY